MEIFDYDGSRFSSIWSGEKKYNSSFQFVSFWLKEKRKRKMEIKKLSA